MTTTSSKVCRVTLLIAAICCAGKLLESKSLAGPGGTVSTAIPLEQPDNAPVLSAAGEVTIRKTATTQQFTVEVTGISQGSAGSGLGVFVGTEPFSTNHMHFVYVMDGPGTVGSWSLKLANAIATNLCGVSDLSELADRYIQIADVTSNIFLETIIPPLVSNPASLNVQRHLSFQLPNPAPSPQAKGVVLLKYNGKTGASSIEVRMAGLSAGNSYCEAIVTNLNDSYTCPTLVAAPSGSAEWGSNTALGQQIALGALSNAVVSVYSFAGGVVEVRDEFGVLHAYAPIPSQLHP